MCVALCSRYVITAGVSVTGSTVGATHETGEINMSGKGSTASIWYYFTAAASTVYTVSSASSSFDTVMGVFSFQQSSSVTVASLTVVRGFLICFLYG